jgi:hypothetical protein
LNKEDIYKANNILKKYATKPLEYSSNGKYRSHYGTYMINNVHIDLVAEFQYIKRDGKWSEIVPIDKYNVFEFKEMELKLLPLELELKEYYETKRMDKYQKIKNFLE